MLTRTKPPETRHRTRVNSKDDDAGTIHCTVYPTTSSKVSFTLGSNTKTNGIAFNQLAKGTVFDLILVGNEVAEITAPAVHPFDIKTLYPEGLESITATVETPAVGIYGPVIAKAKVDGQEVLYRITSLTKLFQAQEDGALREKIIRNLKVNDSVVLRVQKDATVNSSGQDALKVLDVEYMSVNFR